MGDLFEMILDGIFNKGLEISAKKIGVYDRLANEYDKTTQRTFSQIDSKKHEYQKRLEGLSTESLKNLYEKVEGEWHKDAIKNELSTRGEML